MIGWIGALKFTSYEAQGIQPLVANSPLMSWLYDIFTVNTFSALLGVVEITTAVLLCVKPWWPRISMIGSVMAIGLFLGTLSFLFTTPGVGEASAGGFPVLSANPGQFLIKDVALLGLAVWTFADAMAAARRRTDDGRSLRYAAWNRLAWLTIPLAGCVAQACRPADAPFLDTVGRTRLRRSGAASFACNGYVAAPVVSRSPFNCASPSTISGLSDCRLWRQPTLRSG